eukprot:CAMPEP_0114550366 /NCGR_PEP_ID=MMETSP0114-20121206/6037_1 /TAXON_ID=31324 /ORGANISM="Goniomonas sp, Strain m" /LENGTH=340 /DNA_ID=CAMNT_0001735139 /DNA_START=40 /DNA_END=1062 /DNA_ORIENTATION=+
MAATTNQPSQRDFFDEISLNVISFLENHRGVTNVKFHERSGASQAAIMAWERHNTPYVLPQDYKHFLALTDGLLLRWDVAFQDQNLSLGCMHLNSLSAVKPMQIDASDIEFSAEDDHPSDPKSLTGASHAVWSRARLAAFDLDSTCMNGRVALLYKRGFNNPAVWFQDLSCKWNFVADSFTDYFRLVIMHLGLPHWQYAYTEIGMDRVSQQWFRFLSPERLSIDLEHFKLAKAARETARAAGVPTSTSGRQVFRPSDRVAGDTDIIRPLDLDSIDRNARPLAQRPRAAKKKTRPPSATQQDRRATASIAPSSGARPPRVMPGNTLASFAPRRTATFGSSR